MKLIKPNAMAFMQRTFGVAEQYYYVISATLFFDLTTGEILPEQYQWQKIAKVLKQTSFDLGLPKASAEYLLAGTAYAPDENTKKMQVCVGINDYEKELTIYGSRSWRRNIIGQSRMTSAGNFQQLPLSYEFAYGGTKAKNNPIGTGFTFGSAVHQIEMVEQPVKHPGQKVAPAGFMPLPEDSPQRTKFHGSYSNKWFDQYFPALPADMDLRFFNVAPEDQQFIQFFSGDEHYLLTGLAKENKQFSGYLPKIKARSFVTIDTQFQEVPMQLDTLWFLPDANLGAVIYRGIISIDNHDAKNVSQVMLAYEGMLDPAKSLLHYQQVSALRNNKKTATLQALNQSPLMPLQSAAKLTIKAEKLSVQKSEKLALLTQQQAKILKKLPKEIQQANPVLPTPTLSIFDEILSEDIQQGNVDLSPVLQKADQQIATAKARGKAAMAQLTQTATASKIAKITVTKEQSYANALALVKSEGATTKEIPSSSSIQMAIKQRQAKQMTISKDDVNPLSIEAQQALRTLCLDRLSKQLPLSLVDFTGADLSSITFSELDLTQTVFSFTNLQSCVFYRCQLDHSALCNADLSQCEFIECNLKEVNFSGVFGEKTHIEQCDLSGSQWRNSRIVQAKFFDCYWQNSMLLACQFIHSYFEKCRLSGMTFSQSSFNDSDFIDCQLEKSIFTQTKLNFSRWQGCHFLRVVVQMCQLTLSYFNAITSDRLMFSTGSDLTRSLWVKVQCQTLGLRTINATAIRIIDSQFTGCDFSFSQLQFGVLQQTKLERCIANDCNFSFGHMVSCNCYRSKFRYAIFHQTTLQDNSWLDADLMFADFTQSTLAFDKHLSKVAARDQHKRNIRDEQTSTY